MTPQFRSSWRQAGVGLAVMALILVGPPSGVTAQASAQTAEATSVQGVGLQVGQPAPDFTVTTLDGQPLTSADLQAQEKPFILYFFASW